MFGTPTGRPVVVAVDGSPSADRALTWAVREAQAERRALRVVHVWDASAGAFGYIPPDYEALRTAAEELLDDAVVQARESAPDLDVTGVLAHGAPTPTLLDNAADASVLVVGSHGKGGFAGLLLGSTSIEASAHATVPVVVVRGERSPAWDGPVVVGLDGSELSTAALDFGFEAASRRNEGLTVLYAWNLPNPYVPDVITVLADESAVSTQARLTMAETLAGWREKYPDVAVTEVAVRGHPVDALVEASTRSGLVVVGSRGRGGFRGMLLGSVSQGVLRHAACPVAVVRRPT